MLHRQFELVKSGLATGILVVALCFQMLPFFFLILVVAYGLGVPGPGLLLAVPALFLALVVGGSWLVSIRPRQAPAMQVSKVPKAANRPRQEPDVLMKTRDERYQDLKDILVGIRR